MSASIRAKDLGAKSLRWVSERYGISESGLQKAYRDNPDRFDVIVAGCVSLYGGRRVANILQDRLSDVLEDFV